MVSTAIRVRQVLTYLLLLGLAVWFGIMGWWIALAIEIVFVIAGFFGVALIMVNQTDIIATTCFCNSAVGFCLSTIVNFPFIRSSENRTFALCFIYTWDDCPVNINAAS